MAGSGSLFWLIIAVACQFLWGTYPAAVRYMQTRAKYPLTSLQLSLMINLLACPALFFGNTLPMWLHKMFRRRSAAAQSEGLSNGAATKPPAGALNGKPPRYAGVHDSALAEPLLGPSAEQHGDVEAAPSAPLAPNGLLPHHVSFADEPTMIIDQSAPNGVIADDPTMYTVEPPPPAAWKVLMLTTFFLSALFLCQVFSLLFTTAYLSQMVFLLAPVIVAFLAKALFKSPLPPGLWPALALMLLGCSMVIGSKAMAAGTQPKNGLLAGSSLSHPQPAMTLWADRAEEAWLCVAIFGEERGSWLCDLEDDDSSAGIDGGSGSAGMVAKKKKKQKGGLGPRDALGIGLSFLGALGLASFMTTVQRARGVVSDQTVLWCNFLTQLPICFTLTYVLEHDKFPRLLHLGLVEYAEVFAMAAGVNWFANWIQQMCIRNLGAPQAAAFLPVRLLGSLAASYPLLGEGLVGPLQWGGAFLLLAAVSWYLMQQKKAAELGSRSTAALMALQAEAR